MVQQFSLKDRLIQIRNEFSDKFNKNFKDWNKKQRYYYSLICSGLDQAISNIIKFEEGES